LNSKYLYLTVDFLSFIFPFLFSFYPKAPFYKKWKYLFVSISITLIVFILWDILFTRLGIWGFNPDYITGIYFVNLPLEEVLFFICIPYACMFTYEALNYLILKDYLLPYHKIISSILIFILLILGLLNIFKAYTGTTFILLAFLLLFLVRRSKPTYMGRFYLSFLVIILPFLVVNGILTGSFIENEVVWYNDQANLGMRIGTIPVEDVFYGLLMLLLNISIFEKLKTNDISKRKSIKTSRHLL